ncbi:tyrosine-type recombinase/integrase [Anaerotignum propionicum]|uniref:Integrase/recombinase XerD n=1 Tax=Anaerotignum propionicum DSM 1682 TaxID=991789 RepID=A0A0X8V9X3_ANAPI|nr:tyrosine-type recombinase/integrase [Anaerotignum propionicum]AMJ41717.1 tyrosine recombinase XerD [Anaerotignum propionicum DSM 1682]SHE83132.1 integrase/recombinase XerD [[Clostridium] propionicum DSM 1682] [Anaerotignum propionicum DSM 1682]
MDLRTIANEYLFECEYKKFSPRTLRIYNLHINYLIDYLNQKGITEVEDVTPQHIKQYLMAKQRARNKPNYINSILSTYKTMFRYFYKEGYIDNIPTEEVGSIRKEKVIIRTFTKEDIRKMLEYYNGRTFLDVRNKTIIAMFFDTGIRLSELIDLKEEDIKDDYILIKCGKGSKDRVVPKSPFLAKYIFKYQVIREERFMDRNLIEKEFFLSKNCRKLSREMVERIVKDAGEYANVSKDIRVSPHTCRHTFAHMQLMNGLDIYSLSRLLGHENVSITQIYLNGIKDDDVIYQSKKTSVLMNL